MLIYLKLVKSGYGNLEQVKRMNSREVIQALHYEKFIVDYENALMSKDS